jgi:hypothetical protein
VQPIFASTTTRDANSGKTYLAVTSENEMAFPLRLASCDRIRSETDLYTALNANNQTTAPKPVTAATGQ